MQKKIWFVVDLHSPKPRLVITYDSIDLLLVESLEEKVQEDLNAPDTPVISTFKLVHKNGYFWLKIKFPKTVYPQLVIRNSKKNGNINS